jgi:hypothetical protein
MNQLLLDVSPAYIILCLIAALLYSWAMYSKNNPWGTLTNRLLSGVRFLVVFALCFLLLGPHVRLLNFRKEPPKIAIALDNSESLPLITPKDKLQLDLNALQNLSHPDYCFVFFDLNRKIEDLNELAFDNKYTNLVGQLSTIATEFENENLAAVILYSDGIVNRGLSPLFYSFTKPIYTVGIGDTTPRKDVALKSIIANKIAYQGNLFPISAEIIHNGFEGQSLNLVLKSENNILSRKTLTLNQGLVSVDFLVSAESEGTKPYTLSIEPLSGEFSKQNNSKTVFVEILKSKQKILLLGAAVHPDIKALKSAIETNKNYELLTYLPQLEVANELDKIDFNQNFDLVICHQLPSTNKVNSDLLKKYIQLKVPIWFILGSRTDYYAFNELNLPISFKENTFRADKVFGQINPSFQSFSIEENWAAAISAFPPILTNFGGIVSKAPLQVLLKQKIGNLSTDLPLLAVEPQSKMAFFLAEGLWLWRLEDYRSQASHEVFDKLISKLVLYLANKEDKRKFRVYPQTNEMAESEPVLMITEVYNDLYEKIYGQNIELSITDGKSFNRTFSYTHQQGNKFEVGNLPFGVYQYRAQTNLNGKMEVSEGKFIVSQTQMEDVVTVADFNMLRELSQKTGGKFFYAKDIKKLEQELSDKNFKIKVHSEESSDYLINLYWILFALVLFAALEWALRKYMGSY